ncbi:MAG: DUF3313 family protein [Pseudomonadota bacterium]
MSYPTLRFSLAATVFSVASLSPAIAQRFDKVEHTSNVALSSYEQVYIAPVEIDLSPNQSGENAQIRARENRPTRRKDSDISERDQLDNIAEFQETLTDAFAKKFELVDQPGDGVLTVDATITELISNRPTSNDLGRSQALSLGSISAGGAAYRVELKEDDELLVQISDRYKTSLTDQVPRLSQWQDAHKTFKRFSRQLAKYTSKHQPRESQS